MSNWKECHIGEISDYEPHLVMRACRTNLMHYAIYQLRVNLIICLALDIGNGAGKMNLLFLACDSLLRFVPISPTS